MASSGKPRGESRKRTQPAPDDAVVPEGYHESLEVEPLVPEGYHEGLEAMPVGVPEGEMRSATHTAAANTIPFPGTTGRFLVLMRKDQTSEAAVGALTNQAGLRNIARSSEFAEHEVRSSETSTAQAVVFDKLGVVVIQGGVPDQISKLRVAVGPNNMFSAIEPERVVYAQATGVPSPEYARGYRDAINQIVSGIPSPEYVRGYRDAVNQAADRLFGLAQMPGPVIPGLTPSQAPLNEMHFTWGLQITGVNSSRYSGRGVKIAILDTGFDLGHPDYIGRNIIYESFVDGESVQDNHGHGTHCVGTACGPQQPRQMPRYGVAYGADIYVGKVLNNHGTGVDGDILAGIEWAFEKGCDIISMSLTADPSPQGYSEVFEEVALRGREAGAIIVAAAGNDSYRPNIVAPVCHPANCPTILAVAALDSSSQVAAFSNGGMKEPGGQIAIAAPGVAVRSSWPQPILYRSIQGTSMATPHVAGIAALWAEANPGTRGDALADLLLRRARGLAVPATDVGVGLVQAP